MLVHKKIKVGKKYVEALCIKLLSKSFVLIRGSKGYIMCGYLNLEAAEKFEDVAAKIVGVSNIEEALKASIHSCSSAAKKLGIHVGQPVKEALQIIV